MFKIIANQFDKCNETNFPRAHLFDSQNAITKRIKLLTILMWLRN